MQFITAMSSIVYKPKNPIRIVTAAALFDGHDASINIMRRILQSTGVEVIHLGHDRQAQEVVDCAIQEDVQAIAITSYQGGHMEYFKYMFDLLKEKGCSHIKIFGGGGGVILLKEIEELHAYGISRIYSPDDGRNMGLQGMINEVVELSDFPTGKGLQVTKDQILERDYHAIAQLISAAENHHSEVKSLLSELKDGCSDSATPVLGITGTGGAGKSSLADELVRRFLIDFPDKTLAIISIDPSKRKTGGALLGDRIRMNAINTPRVFMRSLATRQANLALSKHIAEALCVVKNAGFDLVILETSGIGQSDSEIVDYCDVSMYVMTPEYGAATQLEKIDMLDYADLVALNKSDKRGAQDALRDVRKQFARNRLLFSSDPEKLPVFATMASQYNDHGTNLLYRELIKTLNSKTKARFDSHFALADDIETVAGIIPSRRVRYLGEISETVREYNKWSEEQAAIARRLYGLHIAIVEMNRDENLSVINTSPDPLPTAFPPSLSPLIPPSPLLSLAKELKKRYQQTEAQLTPANQNLLDTWAQRIQELKKETYTYLVRGKEVKVQTYTESLSHLRIPKIAMPKYNDWGDILRWCLRENVPGEFPYASGLFPFKRENEDTTRMFAGEGGPERTNKRFHYVSLGTPAKRLSTAFDSVTLYGSDPGKRPDIYGKIGNAGVSVACLDDAKKLYSGFNLCDPATSVSMTINGPAPAMLGFFMNTAIDQQCEMYIRKHGLEEETEKKIIAIYQKQDTQRPAYQGELPEGNNGLGLMLLGITGDQVLPAEVYNKIKSDTISNVRGTVQADILKEDQAQNTCIFSTDFALRLMGDVQQYFIENHVRNFYSVSISGYHIAEAGANPITQLAFTLANGFTYVEYFTSRGMAIDKFAPNLSFFFSNGIDPEYSVMGKVARLIWAKAMKGLYKAGPRSQMLKYHIQTSGRSLHAQEIDFNDIRTTLQALYAIYDNCNSLHTNAYDEAITTPTEESVRRAIAIQMIINKELGLTKNQNPLQGSFIIEELTDLVEEAVLAEFDRINERGGVLGAMETMYQRGKIQEESLYYEHLKHTGELPIMGVNTFLSSKGSPTIIPEQVIRATKSEQEYQINMLEQLYKTWRSESNESLIHLRAQALHGGNLFESLMEATKYCSLGQMTQALFEVGGQYRRNM
jgi:methylmalonyl-CoA mutase